MSKLADLLGPSVRPIAISFVTMPPTGVNRVAAVEPAGCGYWRRAAAGETFWTESADHVRCPVGAHTHNIALTPEQSKELEGLVGTMIGLEYLTMDDVAKIPRRSKPFQYAVYAPLDQAPLPPDVVLVRGNARQLMLLAEAAQAAGVQGDGATLGRPTCAVLPQAIESKKSASSFGCIGNRVYTDAADDEAWFAIPGDKLAALEARLAVIVNANRELEKFHRSRAEAR
jgi:uncharacterized protein (DUF169 family)